MKKENAETTKYPFKLFMFYSCINYKKNTFKASMLSHIHKHEK